MNPIANQRRKRDATSLPRLGLGKRWLATAALAALAAGARADHLLTLSARATSAGDARVAEVLSGDQVLIRLRSTGQSPLPRAERAVTVLREALLRQVGRPSFSLATVAGGEVSLRVGAEVVVTADTETARLSGSTASSLAAAWLQAAQKALGEPYLVLSGDTSILVPVGECRYMHYGGPLARALTAETDRPEVATVSADAGQRLLTITGRARGVAVGSLHAGGQTLKLQLEARKWAALIPATATGTLTGTVADEDLARKTALNAALCAAVAEPGAAVAVTSVEGRDPAFSVGLAASGSEYLETRKIVAVALRRAEAPNVQPVDVLVSNTPERIPGRGCLMREELAAGQPVRFLYHHVNVAPESLVFMLRVVNAGREPAAVHVALGDAGPNGDELATGHAAARRFWQDLSAGAGYVLQAPPGSAAAIVRCAMPPNTIVSGLGTLTALTGGPLYVEILAQSLDAADDWLARDWRPVGEAPKLSNFRFPGKKVREAEYQVGGKWAFVSIGREGSVGASGAVLAGDYGVLQEIVLGLVNPEPDPAQVEILVKANGGLMRGTFRIDGTLYETSRLTSFQEEPLGRWEVPARSGRLLRLQTIPESASNYPITLIVRTAEGAARPSN